MTSRGKMLGGKLEQGDTAGHEIAQVYPVVEKSLHNLQEPSKCFCVPVIFIYTGMDGKPDFTTVEHKWIQ
jgi:hypothetical protein